MDIDGDEKISQVGDVNILVRMDIEKINQNQYASNPQKILYKNTNQVIEEYMNNLSEEFKNSEEYSFKKVTNTYILNVTSGSKLDKEKREELISLLPAGTNIVVEEYDENDIEYTIKYTDSILGKVTIATYTYGENS